MAEDSIVDVNNWGLTKTIDWLEENNVSSGGLQSLDQLHDLVRAEMDKEKKHGSELFNKLHVEMENILTKNTHMTEEIVRMYDALIAFYGKKLPDDIKSSIQELYGKDTHQKIVKYKEDVSNKKCSIVVTGETSAGKSSFLNLLLGEMVLHSSLLCSTRRLCHIHSIPAASPFYFEVTMEDGSRKPFNEYYGDKDKFIQDLEGCVTSADTSLRIVDIYWHVPLLGDNTHVTLVDSPGIGDNQELSEELLNYLPNASALIFVINSSNCGGVQGDKLGKIFSRLNSEIKDKNLFSFDPKCTMFILNKWDKLEEKKKDEPDIEESVWSNTLDKLTENLTGFSWETCMYKMSIQDAITYRNRGMVTDKYLCMLTGLKQLVASSMSVNCRRHCRWLTELIEDMKKYLTIRLEDATSNYEENDTKYKDASLRLSKLGQDVDYIRIEMEQKCDRKCDEIAAKMHDHIHSLDVKTQLKRRIKIETATDEELMKESVLKQLSTLVVEEVQDFEKREQIIAKARDQLRMDINQTYHILIEKLVEVEHSIENKKSEVVSEEEKGMSIGEAVLMSIGVTIGIPVAVALSLAFIPFYIPVIVAACWSDRKAVPRPLVNQEELKDKCLKMTMQKMNKDVFIKYVIANYLPQLKKQIDHISNNIPRKIKGLEQLVKDMQNKRLSSKEIKEMYEPALESVKSMVFTLYKFNLTHISEWNIDVGRVRITQEICTSDSLIVYAAKLCSDEEESKVVIKLLPDAPTLAYLKTVEVLSVLRKTNHKNVVAFIGFCYTDGMPAIASHHCISTTVQFRGPRLMTVFEMCDETLEDFLLNHEDLKCGNTQNRTNQKQKLALQFFSTTGHSVCEGMLYMYDQGVLSYINLNNIMMKDGHVKINPPMLGSFSINQREWPRAPELKNGQYTKETDVFYVGKLLWELWYGRKASEPTCSSTEDNEPLPDCKLKHAMPEKLAQIFCKCLDEDPKQRPSLDDVVLVLIRLQ